MAIKLSRTKKQLISLIFFIILLVQVVNVVSIWTYRSGLKQLLHQGNIRLELYINYLQGILGKYESLPELLAIDSSLVRALLNPTEKKRIEILNRYLETINSVSDTMDTYLMNKDGLTIAASNWNAERPFIGRNFSYRPYFKEAMKGKLGRYFALGSTSSKRGYYFAYPVRKDEHILGAVAVKINIDSVEQSWAAHHENFLVSDPDGVIFITTNPEWRFKSLKPLSQEVIKRIQESRRYSNASLLPLSRHVKDLRDEVQILDIDVEGGGEFRRVLKQTRFMPEAGWNVHILTDIRGLNTRVRNANIMVAAGLTLTYVLLLLLIQRHYRLAELDRLEEESKRALTEANELLESRVLDRTSRLTQANSLLKKEIIDRKKTEIKLKRTRKELIHAAKLAVLGQMSAGINHELNQPLAAIRSYTDNGKQFLEKGRLKEAGWNLDQIGELTERMAEIGNQLKLFSRKSRGLIDVVPLHGVIDGALEILNPSLKRQGVALSIDMQPENLEVRANHVLLQQVLVNLITNAMQATEGLEHREVRLDCNGKGESVVIAVEDNGPGVLPENYKRIFEPFFTTKKSGQGLGLGLAITDRIVRDFGGEIVIVKGPRGARFEFTLEKIS